MSYDRTCVSDTQLINVTIANIDLDENKSNKSIIKIIDVLGRDTQKKSLCIKIYSDGSVEKRFTLK